MSRNLAILCKIEIESIMVSVPFLDTVIENLKASRISSNGFQAVPNSGDDPYFDELEKTAVVEDPSATRRLKSRPGIAWYAALGFACLAAFLFVENVRLKRYGSLQMGYEGELG